MTALRNLTRITGIQVPTQWILEADLLTIRTAEAFRNAPRCLDGDAAAAYIDSKLAAARSN